MAKKKKLPKAQEGNFSKFMTWATGAPGLGGIEYTDDMLEPDSKSLELNGTPPKTIKATDYLGKPLEYFNAKAKERKDSAHKSKYRNINGELESRTK